MAYGKWKKQPPLYGVRVPGSGSKPATYAFIIDRPGKSDPRSGSMLSGGAGMEFDRYLRLAQITRADTYVTAICKEYTDEDPTDDQVCAWLPELLDELEEVSPLFIVPLGRFAIRHFLGDVDVEQVHGLLHPDPSSGGRYIYPCFSPSAGLHSADSIPFIHSDFLGLASPFDRLLPVDSVPCPDYRERIGMDLLTPAPIAIDSEGYLSDPWSLQYSQVEGEGRVVYKGGAVDEWARSYRKHWSAGGHTYLHNSLHDLQVLGAMGVEVRDGSFTDTMVLAYNLRLPPQGLKPLAYRLAGMEMEAYEEVTGTARQMVQGEWLAGAISVADSIPPPEEELLWDDKKAAWRIKQPQTVAARLRRLVGDLAAESEGRREGKKAIDIAARVSEWQDDAAGALGDICGEVPEPTLMDIPRARAEHYACRDSDATLRVAPHLIRTVHELGLDEVAAIDHGIIPIVNEMQKSGMLINPAHFHAMDDKLTQWMSDKRDAIEGMVGIRINPSSPKQVADLLFKQLGLPSRKLTKGGDDSTQDKVLEGLRHEHPVLPLILDYREYDKVRGSFCRKMPRLAGVDGRVRGNIRITRVESGRLAMNTPNLMAIPVRSALGRELREGFIAAPGNVIGNWDLDQIEMREITDVSQDRLLIELFSDPNRDIHSETAARMFDKPVALIDAKTERYAAKRVGFGIATQITGAGLVDQMELAGATHADGSKWTESECDDLIGLWFGVYPGVRRFIDRTKAGVRRDGTVRDRWGRLRYLPGVYSSVGHIREESLRQGPSHVIQAGAQGYMKLAMARIWAAVKREGLLEMGVKPLLQIHDSIMFEFPEWLWGVMNEIVLDGLEGVGPERGYTVPITASGEKGTNWGKMKEDE